MWEVYRELQKEKENQTGTRKLTRNGKVKLSEIDRAEPIDRREGVTTVDRKLAWP